MNPRNSLLLMALWPLATASVEARIDFNREVRPILSDKCFKCHGFDAATRKGKLRLDVREDAQKVIESGELINRVTTTDADDIMPPAKDHEPLKAAEIAVLKRWIAEGAEYQKHWAFVPPKKSAATSIDEIVRASLAKQGLKPSPEAEETTLKRRVSLALTGLPHSSHDSHQSYEDLVDDLLASPHFGEHMAVSWLDAARYADTNGYFGDKPRQMWLWRDWVIQAFNSNMPFDQFTIEQLAGDLLPEASVQQRIATGFNRNHVANNESGIIDEEFRTEYVVDRVDTTMTTWMGLTAGCAQCHDHKFDPITQREFYQLFAFFNQVPESGLIKADNPPPLIEVPSVEQRRDLARAKARLAEVKKIFAPMEEVLKPKIALWEQRAAAELPATPADACWHEPFDGPIGSGMKALGTTLEFAAGVHDRAAKFDATQHVEGRVAGFNPDAPWSIGFWVNAEGSLSCPLSLIEPTGQRRGLEMIWQKGRLQVNLVHRWGANAIEVATVEAMSAKTWHHVVVSYDGSRHAGGLRVFIDATPSTLEVRRDTLEGSIANDEPLRIGRRDVNLGFYGSLDELRILPRAMDVAEVADWFRGERILGILQQPVAKRSAADAEVLLDDFVTHLAEPSVQKARQDVKAAIKAEKVLREAIPTTLVMQEMTTPRSTHVLERGQYDKPLAKVLPGVPAALAPWNRKLPMNRLGFARWLVAPENPLTARVAVNRLWQQCFGEGLVRTPNDFGTQGEQPTHPDLLDWLACTFRESGWDVKKLLRLIVTSQTYRQRSQFPAEGSHQDVENRLLARGPSMRLSAEMLRDQSLALSGLLVPRVGGPSVKPFQPSGLWEAVSYNGEESYQMSAGEDQWRRSLYTYVKRQAPPPALLTFDGPTREKCTVRRSRTNTPLQALLLLNDDTFLEAARVLAERQWKAAPTDESRLHQLWQRVLLREPEADEVTMLRGLLARQRAHFSMHRDDAVSLLSIGAARRDPKLDVSELAAWTLVAHTLLNLDEAIMMR